MIVCASWDGKRRGFTQGICCRCQRAVYIKRENLKLVGDCSLSPMCLPCYKALGSPRPAGALLSGQLHKIGNPENN